MSIQGIIFPWDDHAERKKVEALFGCKFTVTDTDGALLALKEVTGTPWSMYAHPPENKQLCVAFVTINENNILLQPCESSVIQGRRIVYATPDQEEIAKENLSRQYQRVHEAAEHMPTATLIDLDLFSPIVFKTLYGTMTFKLTGNVSVGGDG